jgi:pyridoxal phosphate enzyme (YggS family)
LNDDPKRNPDEAHIYKTRLQGVRARIAAAALRSGRGVPDICLLAVSKQQPPEAIRELASLGVRDFGESYLQEALLKQDSLHQLQLTWHYIGQLQANKTRAIAEGFDWVHTVDRVKIAQRLNEQRPSALEPLKICLQIKLAEEAGKGGVPPVEALPLALEIAKLSRLRLCGLMCIPPPSASFASQLLHFEQLRRLLEQLQSAGLNAKTLSMGMSSDLEAAIAAGATIVRIGTALFGERKL